jgi:hypothetical protein
VQPGNEGREFFLSFPANWDYAAPYKYVRLYITARTATQVNVYAGSTVVRTISTIPYGMVTVDLTLAQAQAVSRTDQEPVPDDRVYVNKAVRVIAGEPIVLSAINRITYTSDGILALPTTALGREYVVASAPDIADGTNQRLPSQYVVTAPSDGTVVTIVNAWATQSHAAGESVTVTLNRGDVYSAMSKGGRGDLTGTVITATKPVAVMSGQNCTYLPDAQYPACDHLVEMLTPVSAWGKLYHSVPYASRLKGDLYRVFAGEPNAKIYVNGILTATLPQRGGVQGSGWAQILPTQRQLMEFRSDRKIMVMQYNNSQTYDGVPTDPFLIGLLPLEQFVTEALFTVSPDYPKNYLNMVTDTNTWFVMEIATGNSNTWERISTKFPVRVSDFPTVVNGTRYVGASFEIPPGTYRIRALKPFAGYLYGVSNYDSYGYPIAGAYNGASRRDTGAPRFTGTISCDGTVTATVTDYPDVDSLRSNLSSITLLDVANYRMEPLMPLTPGVTRRYEYKLFVIDRTEDARVVVAAMDTDGNVSYDTIIRTATAPKLPGVVDLGTVALGDNVSDTFFFHNSGSAPLANRSSSLANGTRGFTLAGPVAGFTLQRGETLSMIVNFTPIQAGRTSDTLVITDDCGRMLRTVFTANVEGGSQTIQTSDIDFGTVLIDVPSEMPVIIRNNASNGRPLTISGASGPHTAAFGVIGGMPSFPFVLLPGETRTIMVRFDPSDQIRYQDSIIFTHDAPPGSGNDNIAILNGSGTFTVDVADNGDAPRLALGPVAPMPVDGGWATLRYMLAEPGSVEITLVDAAGRTVRTLLESSRVESGEHTLRFDASTLAAGTYYCRMSLGGKIRTCPVVVR